MDIRLLYFDDCPTWQTALENLRAALDGLEISAEVRLVRVETDEQAVEAQFTGSPTIRVDGAEIFPANHTDYALGCRIYTTPAGLRGCPTVDMIQNAIQEMTNQ